MREEELKERTKKFALRVIRLVRALPSTPDAKAIGRQLLRPAPPWAPTIGLPVVRGRNRNSLQSWGPWRKRRTRARSGWS